MRFSKYIWNLYKESEIGKNEIALFKSKDIDKLSEKFNFEIESEIKGDDGIETFNLYEDAKDELKSKSISDYYEARELFDSLVIENIKDEKENDFLEFIAAFSTALHHFFPDFFLPFYYTRNDYPQFIELCNSFGISLPENPPRKDWVKRTWFYFDVCERLHEFRRKIGIESLEFPAFMYYFGIHTLKRQEEQDLPKPSKAYFVGGSKSDSVFLDNADITSTNTWGAGNLNIKKGDIVLMYCLSPRSSLHSIWRATEDSFINPFDYYYYRVKIGFPKKIPAITLQEFKDNIVFKDNSTVRGNMQGLNGRSITVKEYHELFKLIEQKEKSTNDLPKLPKYKREIDHIENERDVEIHLIEPLLKDLNFEEKDWIRQFPLRMGRTTKYYPDYAILAKTTKGNEKAKYILEAKYSINSEKQLTDAFQQARSYALRLQSEKLILADRDYIWLYERKNGSFQQNPILKSHWNELIDSDNLYELKEKLPK